MEAPAYYLHLPPTPIKARFIMLEETSHTFYDVDTITPELGNPVSWVNSGLSPTILGTRLAIVIPARIDPDMKMDIVAQGPMPDGRAYNPDFEVGRLVSITKQVDDMLYANVLGKLNVCPFRPEVMDWAKLKDMKGAVMADELHNGLLGKVYGGIGSDRPFVHPDVLEKMPRKWHVDAAAMNYELDGIFASGLAVGEGKVKWVLSELVM